MRFTKYQNTAVKTGIIQLLKKTNNHHKIGFKIKKKSIFTS